MSLATAKLPEDIATLRAFALACQNELKAAQLAVQGIPPAAAAFYDFGILTRVLSS